MKAKTASLEKVLASATKRPIEVWNGEAGCFHGGNRVSITRTHEHKPGEELTGETVAEVWITSDDVDKYDGALLVHGFNHIGDAVQGLEEALAEMRRMSTFQTEPIRKTRELIARLKTVKLPGRL